MQFRKCPWVRPNRSICTNMKKAKHLRLNVLHEEAISKMSRVFLLEDPFQCNIYQVEIGHVNNCSCHTNNGKHQACQHIMFVLMKVLQSKLPTYIYQNGFNDTELEFLYRNAPKTVVSEPIKSVNQVSIVMRKT